MSQCIIDFFEVINIKDRKCKWKQLFLIDTMDVIPYSIPVVHARKRISFGNFIPVTHNKDYAKHDYDKNDRNRQKTWNRICLDKSFHCDLLLIRF